MREDRFNDAVALIRERASAATPGPWHLGKKSQSEPDLQYFGNPAPETEGPVGLAWDADTAHIAPWHPVVAGDVADLLAAVQGLVEDYPDLGREHPDGEACTDHACQIVTAARTLVDDYLGDM